MLCAPPLHGLSLSGLPPSRSFDPFAFAHYHVTLTARPEPTLDASPGLDVDTRSLARNALALFGGQLVGLVGPLLTIPYLARVLGPEAWAPILVAQGLANWLMLVLEFGFDLSGTR